MAELPLLPHRGPRRLRAQGDSSGTRVVEYIGRIISKAESEQLCEDFNEYIFSLTDDHDLDGNVEWNPARLINHSCEPSCSAEQEGEEIWIVADQDIQLGEEVTFNYGYSLDSYRPQLSGLSLQLQQGGLHRVYRRRGIP